tara:strand:- start:1445 stop:2014 length:570 start_codon:yes stop_codon:yes gene_type:complete
MKKSLTERFQQLAGIKPLYEQDINPDGTPVFTGKDDELEGDVQQILKLVPKINNKEEWEELITALFHQDVASVTPSIKKQWLRDTLKTSDQQAGTEGGGGEDAAIKYLSDSGTLHVSYVSGKGVEMKAEDWAQYKGMYTINNDRLGYVKDDGSLHSAPMPDSVGEREALMDYIKNNFEENSGVPVVGSN